MKVLRFGATGLVGQGLLRDSVARTLRARNRDLGFVYLSGAGTDERSRMMCARVKGRTATSSVMV